MPKRPRLMWRAVEPESGDAAAARAPRAAAAPAPPARPRFAQLPSVADATTPREDAIGLLQVAAEVEHALLVQYLYANASVVRSTGGLSVSATIRTIAVEEMGHLVTVQNLLLALGGPAAHHFGRDVGNPDFVPIPFVLEPLDRISAAKYVVVERPKHIADAAVLARVEALESEVHAATGFDPNRVGALYAAIYWILQPSDDPFGPEPFTVDDGFRPGWHVSHADFLPADEIAALATTIDEWHNFPGVIAAVVTDALTACEAVHAIMAQGEGVSASDDSHFEEFLAVLDAVEAGRVTMAPLPCSPFVQGQPRPADPRAVQLTNPHTAAWAGLLNLVYTHVVGCIANALARPFGDATRGELIDIALTAMRPVLTVLTRQIVKLPVTDAGGPPFAGPTFGLLREDWPADPAAFKGVHLVLLAAEDAAIAAIQARPEHANDAQGRMAVDAVKTKLQDRIRLLLPDSEESSMSYAVFPPIGIARIGNSTTDSFVGPERPDSLGVELLPDGTERDIESTKDAQHRVKRQAARFQVFEVDAAGLQRPAVLPDGASVRWTVRLVNKKDAVVRPGSPPSQPIRPVAAAGAEDRVIDSGNVSVDAGGTASLDGTYRTTPVHLGDASVDAMQRLLVLGGTGRAASPTNAPIGGSFYNNPGWFDDLADGPVSAEIVLADGTVHTAEPAWVIVAPPDFAPGCGGVVTLYDVLLQVGVDLGQVEVPARPNFWRDVQPMIRRASTLQWVTNDATWPLVSTDWAALADPSPAAATLRAENAEFVRSAEALLHQHELRDWQRQCLSAWEAGDFDATPPGEADVAVQLTRTALDATVGQGFFPGIEAGIIVTDPQIYLQPFRFRLDHAVLKAGDLTALMALPWQADFLKCNSGWWPTQRPDVAPQAAGSRPPWLRPSMNHARLVRDVMRLGVITPVAGGDSQVEVGRDPTL